MYWLVGLPLINGSADKTWDLLQRKTTIENAYSMNYKLEIPSLRVGTLDSLMQLSDELSKVNSVMEGIVNKIRRQIVELQSDGRDEGGEFSIDGTPVEQYITKFVWDEARYPTRRILQEVVDLVVSSMTKVEDDLKTKVQQYAYVRQQYNSLHRKTTGSLAVRDVSNLLKPEHIISTEHLTTLVLVVHQGAMKTWETCYEQLNNFVVPRSSVVLCSEKDYCLVRVVLFRKMLEDFKQAAKNKGFQPKDVPIPEPADLAASTYASAQPTDGAPPANPAPPPNKNAADGKKEEASSSTQATLAQVEQELAKEGATLSGWCRLTYGEAFAAWVHICVIRLFVESVLRYGLPPSFATYIMAPSRKVETKVRKSLAATFSGIDSDYYVDDGSGINDGEMYPYVSFTVDVDT